MLRLGRNPVSVHAQSLDVAEVLQSSVDDTYNLKEDEVKAALEEVESMWTTAVFH